MNEEERLLIENTEKEIVYNIGEPSPLISNFLLTLQVTIDAKQFLLLSFILLDTRL